LLSSSVRFEKDIVPPDRISLYLWTTFSERNPDIKAIRRSEERSSIMGLLRIVIQRPNGKPFAGLSVALRQAESSGPGTDPLDQGKTDDEGVVRFRKEPGIYQVEFQQLSEGMKPPRHGTMVRLEEITEGIEQIIRLVEAG
jgi:5-hydroxyisourate hydrolase-like protein (transthyretin family)